jgi:fructosamine-3-kinase
LDMFEAEAIGLKAIGATGSIKVPKPFCFGVERNHSFLALEYLNMVQTATLTQFELGEQVAKLHQTFSDRFGWQMDNTIGKTRQINSWTGDWIEFYRKNRLLFQFDLARRRGVNFKGERKLLDSFESLFEGYQPRPSMIHGDLWSGNVGFCEPGGPVIFDPATYYGDREAEFGIIEMFGGFSAEFYRGYQKVYPLDSGFKKRLGLYVLYHQLNHLNLFGQGYYSGVHSTMENLLTQIG